MMKFDTVIVGGGLAGLVCGIYLSERGQRCAILSSGQSALHFSSGSLDLLNALPDGRPVERPLEAMAELERLEPEHPYAKIGSENMAEWVGKVNGFLQTAGVPVVGNGESNHYRVTPLGTLRPAWLTLKGQLACPDPDRLPWKKVAVFHIAGFLDFYARFITDEFRKLGTQSTLHTFSLPALERLRSNPTEMRSANIARLFCNPEHMDGLVQMLRKEAGDAEAVVLPAVIGLEDPMAVGQLERALDREVVLVATLPPSVPGIRMQQQLCRCFRQAGGTYLLGETALRAEKEGNRVVRLYACNQGDIPLAADQYVLATGSYFSQGLVAAPERIREPVFDLDIAFPEDRREWYDLDVFAPQPYQRFGVKTDRDFRAFYQGKAVDNLYAAGAVLEGFDALKEGCGGGVSVLSAMYAAERILNR